MDVILNKKKLYAIIGCTFVFGLFLYGLNAILMPFIAAALLAYLGDPLVDKLETMKLSRSFSVAIVFLFLIALLIILILLLGPMLSDQLQQLILKIPVWLASLEQIILPFLRDWGFIGEGVISQSTFKNAIANYWQEGGNFALNAVKHLGSSGAALLGAVTNIVLIPVLTFYLLRDWDIIIEKLGRLVPIRSKASVFGVAKECDEVLSSFLRGQFIVMLSLAFFYSAGLGLIGLETALIIGVIAGLANVIPYMGFVLGIVISIVAAWMQFHAVTPLFYIAVVFAIGQLLEGMFLTPLLVGDKIGLHPVAVLFSLMAGAQLGGFVGLLVALPVAAILMVLVRYFIAQYKVSDLYHGGVDDERYVESRQLAEDEQTVVEIQVDAPVITSNNVNFHEEESVFDDAIWLKDVSGLDDQNTV